MTLMRTVIAAVLIAGLLATVVVIPQVAEAGGRHWNRGGHGYHHSGHSYFWPGLAVGAVTGIVVGSIFAPRVYAAPPVVYQPVPPPVVYQPAPVCSSYWVSTYWNGYQWVPGYWAQACR
ncbi:MAG TPA: hypothetical protein VHF87_03705 [Methylomirabilota bacterium]|jgi:hypothetical protein|nr:hypothetical protein [Methylomirabilota bacterium]